MNIDTITSAVKRTLESNNVDYTLSAIESIMWRWERSKKSLYEILRKHPNWNEDCMSVVFSCDSSRAINWDKFYENLSALIDMTRWVHQGEDIPLPHYLPIANAINSSTVNERLAEYLATLDVRVAENMKVSRALNKLFTKFNTASWVDDEHNYNAIFAAMSDGINPLKIKRPTVLSIHPCDYLNMSHGRNWQSCHRIGGEYCGGIWSYMLDPVTMVFYTVDRDFENADNNIFDQPKINRQLFMYDNFGLYQSRLYPNDNDRDNNDNFRNAAQQIMAQCLDAPNYWTIRKGDEANNCCSTRGGSLQYPDYEYSYAGISTFSTLKDHETPRIYIGGPAYCPVCGDEYDDSEYMGCCEGERRVCVDCGARIHEERDYFHTLPNGDVICNDCYEDHYFTCSECGEIYYEDSMNETITGEFICDRCADRYYTHCDYCDKYAPSDEVHETTDGDLICEDCISNADFHECEECGKFTDSYHDTPDGIFCDECYEEKVEEEETEMEVVM